MRDEQLEHGQHENSAIKYPLTLVLDGLTSALNVGGVFRISDALGIEKIYLCNGTPTPETRQLRRTSRSAERAVDHASVDDTRDIIASLRSDGYTIMCLELSISSTDIKQLKVDPSSRIVLVIGSENSGVDAAVLNDADRVVHIPMLGQNSSMNVASATAIACYEITRQLSA